jgi:type IV pilus modification protein PilV
MKTTKRGFSLTEVLIAIAVIAVGLLGTTAALLYGVRGQTVSGRHTQAMNSARQLMEFIRSKRLYSAATLPNDASPTDLEAAIGAENPKNFDGGKSLFALTPAERGTFRRQITMAKLGTTGMDSRLVEVRVRILWKDRSDLGATQFKNLEIVSQMVQQ